MKFKFSVEFLIVVFLFVSIMIISTYGSTKIMPFEQTSSKLPMYDYEGFGGLDEEETLTTRKPVKDTVKPIDKDETQDKPQTLQWSEYGKGQETPLDIMSQQKSDPSCGNISNGLSNSKGYLCPTEDVQKLQRSRGGNSNGAPDQIGA